MEAGDPKPDSPTRPRQRAAEKAARTDARGARGARARARQMELGAAVASVREAGGEMNWVLLGRSLRAQITGGGEGEGERRGGEGGGRGGWGEGEGEMVVRSVSGNMDQHLRFAPQKLSHAQITVDPGSI